MLAAPMISPSNSAEYALIAMTSSVDPATLHPVDELLHRSGVVVAEQYRVAVPRSLADRRRVVRYRISGVRPESLRAALAGLSADHAIDAVLLPREVRQQRYRLAVFDMDSTLIQCEVIDELAKHAGLGSEVAAITERAMAGELDFNSSYVERLALLAGLEQRVIEQVADALPATEGIRELVLTLRAQGVHTAILSGGFTPFAEHLQARFGFDSIFANTLEVKNGRLTGRPRGPLVDGAAKQRMMLNLAQKLGVGLEQVIAVGDGANDIPMLTTAGLGVAFAAKPSVRRQIPTRIDHVGLDGVLYLLGSEGEWQDPDR